MAEEAGPRTLLDPPLVPPPRDHSRFLVPLGGLLLPPRCMPHGDPPLNCCERTLCLLGLRATSISFLFADFLDFFSQMGGFVLPPFESTSLLKDVDVIGSVGFLYIFGSPEMHRL